MRLANLHQYSTGGLIFLSYLKIFNSTGITGGCLCLSYNKKAGALQIAARLPLFCPGFGKDRNNGSKKNFDIKPQGLIFGVIQLHLLTFAVFIASAIARIGLPIAGKARLYG